ncbi:MAG TPA: H-NS family nucleoid-associated regulatory protein [Caldimonas sp.]|nr:H-NS family nucleoid-associated regulatory protein [Caldimonas sp.]
MAHSYSQLVKQIESLTRKADMARKKEVAGVIGRIKEAIAFYALTAEELGLRAKSLATRVHATSRHKTSHAKSKSKFGDTPKYRDEAGNEWVGRGPRPLWLREAIKSGRSLHEFAIDGAAAAKPAKAAKKATTRRKSRRGRKASTVAKYRDAATGKTWSGRGRKPAWFVNALAEGKSLESMAA